MNFPTPLQLLLDPVSLTVLAMFFALYAWEKLFPRNKNLPTVKYATARGLFAFAVFFFLSSYLPIVTDGFLAQYQLIDLSGLPLHTQVLIGLFTYQFLLYGWHRSMHESNLLWKGFHQMHHSSERLDIPSTFYFSPLDMIGFTFLGSIVFALLMGVSPQAITVIILVLNFLSIFQHANIRTPQWLGYLIQRPEQHAIHHKRGVHMQNYSDLPIYDLIFGTFSNPKSFEGESGFYDGASARVMDMMLFRDVANTGNELTPGK
ncbi:MAG: sterol desaturase family protein [Marinoscillum sp.]|uniref:sterol desaturase family protein n=1 Tax=Marinoscillum sp. TaxID=2024838 RepID=UPI0032FF2BA2